MTADQVNILLAGVAVGSLVVIALAALMSALAARRLSRHVSATATAARHLVEQMQDEVSPALDDMRRAAADVARLAAELPPRLERVDALLDEADATVASLRATAEAAEEMVRGPAAAVDRARRTVNAAGQGLARGADRLVRGVKDRTNRS